jgi:hypothetical protein
LIDKTVSAWHKANYDKQYDESRRGKDMTIIHLRFLYEVRLQGCGA